MSEQKWIDQLKHEHDLYKKHLKVYEDENANLREQNQIIGKEIKTYIKIADKLQVENAELKDQVEKLEKACDMWMLEASKAHGVYYQNEEL